MRVLANDGIAESGKEVLEAAGFEVRAVHVAQEQLVEYINREAISVLIVRSATKVPKDLIAACPGLLLIGRAGVGMDNIDVDYARKKGLHVVNTPAASSDSVAELVFGHLLGGVRNLHESNRQMPLEGDQHFKALKKQYSRGREIQGKTLGIIGFGRIGKAVAKRAYGLGMKVLYCDPFQPAVTLQLEFQDGQSLEFALEHTPLNALLENAHFITLHAPAQEKPLIGPAEFKIIKEGAGLINAARGGLVDEPALLEALESDKLSFAALDVFQSEPRPEVQLLMHPNLSLSPHIGAATEEAQQRIGTEMAQKIIHRLKKD